MSAGLLRRLEKLEARHAARANAPLACRFCGVPFFSKKARLCGACVNALAKWPRCRRWLYEMWVARDAPETPETWRKVDEATTRPKMLPFCEEVLRGFPSESEREDLAAVGLSDPERVFAADPEGWPAGVMFVCDCLAELQSWMPSAREKEYQRTVASVEQMRRQETLVEAPAQLAATGEAAEGDGQIPAVEEPSEESPTPEQEAVSRMVAALAVCVLKRILKGFESCAVMRAS
jgi:hypothetical protein